MKIAQKYLSIAIILLFFFTLFELASHDQAIAAVDGSSKIESSLFEQVSLNGSSDFIMRFTPQADLSAAYSMNWEARGEYVYNTLSEIASRSQAQAKAILDAQGLTYQTFIAGNELYVWGSYLTGTNELVVLNELSALPELSSIRAPSSYSIDPVFGSLNNSWAGDLLAEHRLVTVEISTTATIAWGIQDTKADQFWTDYSHRGDGIVVANIDTGVQWNHPALIHSFKCGANPSDPACWYDPTGICTTGACDNQGHGTHTMGTMVADDNPSLPYIAGMAPDAKWIACKGCENTTCLDQDILACADWVLAPGGNPANRPNVVNNSWGGPGGNDWFKVKVDAWRAAGIFPAFSAGNSSGCPVPGTIGSMGSPGDYQESFTSTAHNSSRLHYYAQGPSPFGHEPYTKPNLSAPGVGILSTYSVPLGSWISLSGTSMASPHSAGAVALLWSCNPSLIGQVDTTFQLLQNTADTPPPGTCSAPADGQGNYTFGYGYLDVLAAGKATCGIPEQAWTNLGNPTGCPDWTRFDGEYYVGTGKVYLMGGRDGVSGGITYGDIYAYDPDTNSCADTSVDMPVPISNYTIARVNNGSADLLCTFGGRSANNSINNSVQCFDPNTNSISSLSTLPGDLGNYMANGLAVVNNRVYIFGGFNDFASPTESVQTWEWDPTTNFWTRKGDMSLGRAYIDTAVVDGKIYAFGGDIYNGSSLIAQTKAEVFNPITGFWDDAGVLDLPVPTGEGIAFGFNSDSIYELAGKVIIAGGGQWPNESAEVFRYNVASNTYSDTLTNLNVSRANQAGFFIQGNPGKMWVFGGRSKDAGYGDNNPPYAPLEYYPVNLAYPDVVEPTKINLTLMQGDSKAINLVITNRNSFPLNWTLTESALAGISNNPTPFMPVVTSSGAVNYQITTKSPVQDQVSVVSEVDNTGMALWDQPLSRIIQQAFINQKFSDYATFSSFLADDFVSGGWTISDIFVPGFGWAGFSSLTYATALTWQIYADDGGIPAGGPSGGGAPPIWSLSLSPTDLQVTIFPGTPGGYPSTVKLTLDVPVTLPPGRYWLIFYPSMDYTLGQYGRQPSDSANGYVGKFINPGNGLGLGTSWRDWSVLDSPLPDIAFRIDGEIPWISENPVLGTVQPGNTQLVTVDINSAGLVPGVYTSRLVFRTNDLDRPLITVPVRLYVSNGVVYLPLTVKH